MDHFTRLLTWLRDNGGYINEKLGINNDSPHNRYIYALDEIQPNEVLLKIPKKCCLRRENKDSDTGENSMRQMIHLLLFNLSLEQQSFFYPYISFLPTKEDLNYHPLYQYNEQTRQQWNSISSHFVVQLDKIIKDVSDSYNWILNNTFIDPSFVTIDNIKWCYLIITSRQWKIGLVPVADLLQHSGLSKIILFTESQTDKESCHMTASNKISKGSQVCDNYGAFSDLSMLLKYGFVDDIENNKLNRIIPVSFHLTETKNMTEKIRNIYCSKHIENINNNIINRFILSSHGIQDELKQLFRLSTMSEKDIKNIDINSDTFYHQMISLDNELNMYRNLILLIKNQGDIFSDNEIKMAIEVVKTADKQSIDYKLAKSVLYHIDVINNSYKRILVEWNSLLNSSYSFDISFNKYDNLLK
jgi:hypothetical protein